MVNLNVVGRNTLTNGTDKKKKEKKKKKDKQYM